MNGISLKKVIEFDGQIQGIALTKHTNKKGIQSQTTVR